MCIYYLPISIVFFQTCTNKLLEEVDFAMPSTSGASNVLEFCNDSKAGTSTSSASNAAELCEEVDCAMPSTSGASNIPQLDPKPGTSTSDASNASKLNKVWCFNCDGDHDLEICEHPWYNKRCYRCLVTSFNSYGHKSPCTDPRSISQLRNDIFGKLPLPMFKFRVAQSESVYALDIDDGVFNELVDGQQVLSPATKGIFTYKIRHGHKIVCYDALKFTRFSILIAIFSNNHWRFRFRVVPTTIHGVLVFKISTKLTETNGRIQPSSDDIQNTPIIIGIRPSEREVKIDFRISARPKGGDVTYTSTVKWKNTDNGAGQCNIDRDIDAQRDQQVKRYDKRLYEDMED